MAGNNFPKIHNALWPGIVGKGAGAEPTISFEDMLKMTAAAEVDGVGFDGVDIGLFEPHVNITSSPDDIKRMADKVAGYGLAIGSLVAPVWGGSAMGSIQERANFVEMVRKACGFGKIFREAGIRKYGIIRIDSAVSPKEWALKPLQNTKLIAQTFREACDVAAEFDEKLAAEGEICWGGMHSWRSMIETMEEVNRDNIGFQADMSHTLLYLLGYNAPEDRILPIDFDWQDREALSSGLQWLTDRLRPWTIDFHIAQNDGTAHGTGSHDKTGRHCLPDDPNGKLDIVHDAGYWLRDETGALTKAFQHICWDGCMFSNEVMLRQDTWDKILATMIKVRDAHGWMHEP